MADWLRKARVYTEDGLGSQNEYEQSRRALVAAFSHQTPRHPMQAGHAAISGGKPEAAAAISRALSGAVHLVLRQPSAPLDYNVLR